MSLHSYGVRRQSEARRRFGSPGSSLEVNPKWCRAKLATALQISDKPIAKSFGYRFGFRMYLELLIDVLQMKVDRGGRDA